MGKAPVSRQPRLADSADKNSEVGAPTRRKRCAASARCVAIMPCRSPHSCTPPSHRLGSPQPVRRFLCTKAPHLDLWICDRREPKHRSVPHRSVPASVAPDALASFITASYHHTAYVYQVLSHGYVHTTSAGRRRAPRRHVQDGNISRPRKGVNRLIVYLVTSLAPSTLP